MKKILLLGGSAQQVIAIKKAKELGYYTIVCDYLDDNPGQNYADKFYLASTTDKEVILEIARIENIDGILAYASDPAAPTAAYVSEKLNLPGNPYKSVDILCNKDKYRKFLAKNGFNTPKSKGYSNVEDALCDIRNNVYKLPVMVKPVDSSGSKGVSMLDKQDEMRERINLALSYSKSKRIIIEEFVESFGFQVAGDGLSINGNLKFRYFANDHFNKDAENPYVPISASFPYNMPQEIHDKIHSEIQRLITLLKMKDSTYNFDIRINRNLDVFLMEVAPRSGGNYIPQVIKYATGVDMLDYAIRLAMGEKVDEVEISKENQEFWSYYAIHSTHNGVLKEININQEVLSNNIVESHIIKKPKDRVEAFKGASSALGILIMKFDSLKSMVDMLENSYKWITVCLEE